MSTVKIECDLHNLLWRESLIIKLRIFINTWTLVCFSSIHFVCLERPLLKLLVEWALSHCWCLFFYKEQNAQWLSVYGPHIYCFYCDNMHSTFWKSLLWWTIMKVYSINIFTITINVDLVDFLKQFCFHSLNTILIEFLMCVNLHIGDSVFSSETILIAACFTEYFILENFCAVHLLSSSRNS